MYEKNDIVLIKSLAVPEMKPIKVRLIKKYVVKARKGNRINWPAYVGWDAVLISKSDATRLKKRWRIPFEFPSDIETFIYEDEIIKKL